MQRLQLNAEDLAKVRVSSSWGPFNEALMSLTHLQRRRSGLLVDGWRHAVRGQLDDRMSPLLVLAPPPGFVDLHTIVGGAPTIADALERVEGAPDGQFRRELDCVRPMLSGAATWMQRWWRDLADGDRAARRALVELIGRYHGSAVAPHWGPIAAHLEAERARCAHIMATQGVGALLARLHPTIRWRPPFLDVNVGGVCELPPEVREPGQVFHVGGRSLVLVPSVFCLDRPWVLWNVLDDTEPRMVVYPALRTLEDSVALWGGRLPPGPRVLARLLGPTRAEALDVVADTCTTTELARRLGVAPATASHHVGILRDAHLIASRRDGSAVRHRLTALGAALLDGHPRHP